MAAEGVPAPAKGLKASGRRLWTSALEDYDFEVHEELLLLQACRCVDRLDLLATEAENNPVTVVNVKGDQVPHPALTESRQQSIVLSRLLASLRMPSGEEGGQLIRPQRRGAARGPYKPQLVRSGS